MPSTNQQGETSDYPSQAARHVAEWDTDWLLNLYPMTVDLAQEYLGEANAQDASKEVKEHFYQQIQRLKG